MKKLLMVLILSFLFSLTFTACSSTKYYNVQFDLNGASGSIPNQSVKNGNSPSEVDNPKWIGYNFDGWSEDKNSDRGQGLSSFRIAKDTTLFAVWNKKSTDGIVNDYFEAATYSAEYIYSYTGNENEYGKQHLYTHNNNIISEFLDSKSFGNIFKLWNDGTFAYHYSSTVCKKEPVKFAGLGNYTNVKDYLSTIPDSGFIKISDTEYCAEKYFEKCEVIIDDAHLKQIKCYKFNELMQTISFKYDGEDYPAFEVETHSWDVWYEVLVETNGGQRYDGSKEFGFNAKFITWPEIDSVKRSGYFLEGVYSDKSFNNKIDMGQPLSGNKTVYLKWVKLTGNAKDTFEEAMTITKAVPEFYVEYINKTQDNRYGESIYQTVKAEYIYNEIQKRFIRQANYNQRVDKPTLWTEGNLTYSYDADNGRYLKYSYYGSGFSEMDLILDDIKGSNFSNFTFYDNQIIGSYYIYQIRMTLDEHKRIIQIDRENYLEQYNFYYDLANDIPAKPDVVWENAYQINFYSYENGVTGFYPTYYDNYIGEDVFGYAEKYEVYLDSDYIVLAEFPMHLTNNIVFYLKEK